MCSLYWYGVHYKYVVKWVLRYIVGSILICDMSYGLDIIRRSMEIDGDELYENT